MAETCTLCGNPGDPRISRTVDPIAGPCARCGATSGGHATSASSQPSHDSVVVSLASLEAKFSSGPRVQRPISPDSTGMVDLRNPATSAALGGPSAFLPAPSFVRRATSPGVTAPAVPSKAVAQGGGTASWIVLAASLTVATVLGASQYRDAHRTSHPSVTHAAVVATGVPTPTVTVASVTAPGVSTAPTPAVVPPTVAAGGPTVTPTAHAPSRRNARVRTRSRATRSRHGASRAVPAARVTCAAGDVDCLMTHATGARGRHP